jgi:DNA-binding winged helix-turn-helix (wHTH) protein/serine/threonine protein kinase
MSNGLLPAALSRYCPHRGHRGKEMESTPQDVAIYRWAFGTAEFDEARWELKVNGQPVDLERKPLELLLQLLRHAGEVLTKDELLESVWVGRIVVEAALTNAIGKLRKALGDDTQTLIASVPRVGYRLTGPVSRKAAQTLPSASVLAAGDAVPRRPNFRLVERLARNHEDVEVWRAEQPKTHDVRVFKFSLDGARLGTLKREVTLSRVLRDALGERDEFVKLLDWDFDEAPFFTESEFGGISLDSWLGQHGVAVDHAARLALMAEIADAVASAHEVGILHKDLKPGNILIYLEVGKATWHPRIADFGSGKVLDASDSHEGTPLYLAPEVVGGQSPTIRSDLYALGVILFQLLVGDFRRPMSPGWEADIDDPLLRTDISAFANGDPAKRPASARELATRLRSLDARRVQLDLEQAVQARIVTSERKLALTRARRPWIVAAMLLLGAGLAGSLFYAHRARESAQAAQKAAKQERQERKLADSVNTFLVKDIIGSADPFQAGVKDLSLKDALSSAEKNIDKRFKDDPEAQTRVHMMLGQAYSGHGEHALARDQYAKAAAAIETHPAIDQTLAQESRLAEAGSLLNLGDMKGVDRILTPVLKAADSGAVLDARLRLRANYIAGQTAVQEGNHKEALARLEKANAIVKTIPDIDPVTTLRLQSVLAVVYGQNGQPEKAVALLKEATAQATRTYGSQHPETLNVRILLGEALDGERHWREAVPELTALKRDAAAVYGADSQQALDADELLSGALVGMGDFQSGLPLMQSAYERRAKQVGPTNPLTLDQAVALADALRQAGRSADALKLIATAQKNASTLPEAAGASFVQRLNFEQSCTLVSQGDLASADKLAQSLDPTAMSASDPAGQWPQRVDGLRKAAKATTAPKAGTDACPLLPVTG